MKFLKDLTKKQKIFQRTLGLLIQQFELLVTRITPLWIKAEVERKQRSDRKRMIGGGHPYTCKTIKEMLVVVLLYYKTYCTQEFIGLMIGLDQANVSRLLKKMLHLIEQAADPDLAQYLKRAKEESDAIPLHQRINSWSDFIKKHPDLRDVSTDATEQTCYRSTNYEKQKEHYSGKKKRHSIKTQITAASTGRIINVSCSVPGSVHDKKLMDQEKTVEKFPGQTAQRFDLGYQGIVKQYPNHYIVLPCKKPAKMKELSPLAKEHNRANSRRRVVVEHAFSRLKKFGICSRLYRGQINEYNIIFRNVAALLNFKLTTAITA
jgi:hypothetical protein